MKTQTEQRKKLTPPQFAKEWGIANLKVIAWIKSGELKAIDVAPRGSKRPRYLIDREAIASFENGRQVVAPPKPTPRKKRPEAAGAKQYF